jgi:DNA-binding response OmpR family regulator/signal transduction histidine kinase
MSSHSPGRRRALVVDDEEALADVLAGYLEREGFEVALAADGPSAVRLAREHDPAVVVLDLGLPGLDGVEVCRSIRTFSDCYILMLTARVDEVDMLIGLSVGADDYMTKPFSPRELVARVGVMMRRPRAAAAEESAPLVSFGALAIDVRGREVSLKGRPVPLTRIEFDVLAALALNPGQVFTAKRSSTRCGVGSGSAMTTSWMCMFCTSGRSSATRPPSRTTSGQSAGWDTGWGPDDDQPCQCACGPRDRRASCHRDDLGRGRGGLTAFLVAALVGPALFVQHVAESGNLPGRYRPRGGSLRSASTLATTIALGSATVTSVAASIFLARRIGASLRTMAEASTRLATGRLDTRVAAPGVGAEFDQLALAFNAMADRLDRDEQLRRRLTADVAHELRTPVATIAATLDALDDDVQQLTPATTAVLRAQASRLTRLSADLTAVSRADSGNLHLHRQPLAPGSILSAAAPPPAPTPPPAWPSSSMRRTCRTCPWTPTGSGRSSRISSTTPCDTPLLAAPSAAPRPPRPGCASSSPMTVKASTTRTCRICSNGSIGWTARDRAHGGSGIGLSVTRALVHAHGGTIAAHSAGPGHGAEFLIELPFDGSAPRVAPTFSDSSSGHSASLICAAQSGRTSPATQPVN